MPNVMGHSSKIASEAVRSQLKRICESLMFVNSERSRTFLQFTVDETLAGRSHQLKEFTLGIEVFHRDENFDPRIDAIVRVEATRVRSKLREYYDTLGSEDSIRIELPKGAYVPEFQLIDKQNRPTSTTGPRHYAQRALIVSGLLILAGIAYFAGSSLHTPNLESGKIETSPSSVAVLPLRNLSETPESEYLSIGMTDALITALAKHRGLRVTSTTSMMRYKNVNRPMSEIARELNVSFLVEGSVLRSGNVVRITAQLIKGNADEHIWAENYERDLSNVLAVQDEVAGKIAEAVLGTVTAASSDIDSMTYLRPEAQADYLKGIFFRGQLTEEGYKKGLEHFKKAVEAEPTFAPAYSGLASCFCLLGGHGLELIEPGLAMPEASKAITKALELAPSLAEPYVYLGIVRLKYEWDWPGAEQAFLKAIELNPSLYQAHLFYSFYLEAMDRPQEAIAEASEALSLNPLSLGGHINLGWQHLQASQLEEALTYFEGARELRPDFWGAYWGIGHYHRRKDEYEEAIAAFERAVELPGGHSLALSALGYTLAAVGEHEQAEQVIDTLKQMSSKVYVSPFHVATVYVGLGDYDEVFQWLDNAFYARSRSLAWLNVAPEYEVLLSDPRLQALIERIGLPNKS